MKCAKCGGLHPEFGIGSCFGPPDTPTDAEIRAKLKQKPSANLKPQDSAQSQPAHICQRIPSLNYVQMLDKQHRESLLSARASSWPIGAAEEIDIVTRNFQLYAQHHRECRTLKVANPACNCGLDEIKKVVQALAERLTAPPQAEEQAGQAKYFQKKAQERTNG